MDTNEYWRIIEHATIILETKINENILNISRRSKMEACSG